MSTKIFHAEKGSVFLPIYNPVGSGSLVTRAAPCSSVKEEEPNTHAVTERKFLANRSPDRPLGGWGLDKSCLSEGGGRGGGENLEHLEHPRPLPLLTRERKIGQYRD